MKEKKLAFVGSGSPKAAEALKMLTDRYPSVPVDEAEIVVALGGDGFVLHCLHQSMGKNVPIFGMNRGSVGFLMNEYSEDALYERIGQSESVEFVPLRLRATGINGESSEALAINEVSLLRETRQASKIRILVDGVERMPEMICDGVLVATPAGSTVSSRARWI